MFHGQERTEQLWGKIGSNPLVEGIKLMGFSMKKKE